MTRFLLVASLVVVAACGHKSNDPIDQLVDTEMTCKWMRHDSFDDSAVRIFTKSYNEQKDKPGMVAALKCLDVKADCAKFATCRDAAAKLDGGN